MNRRRFLETTGAGLAAAFASRRSVSGSDTASPTAAVREVGTAPVTSTDFTALRADFPALQTWTYLDAAFVGLLSRQVRAAHQQHLDERFKFDTIPDDSSILGVWRSRAEVVRAKLAALVGAHPDEVAFTLCTGCGSNIALNGIDWRKGDNALIDDLEYPTDFHILNALKQKGVELRIVRNQNGSIAPAQYAELADGRTRAIVVTHVSNLNGFRHDLKKLAEIIHARNGYLVVDAAQSIGAIKVNVKDEGVDFMSGIPYKWLNGPNGVGFLYVRKEIIPNLRPDRLGWSSTNDFVSLDTMESNPLPGTARRFEYGTLAYESIDALGAALDYVNTIGMGAIEERTLALTRLLRDRLQQHNVRFYTPEHTRSPILSFYAENAAERNRALRREHVYVTARRQHEDYVRVSPHFYNTEEDIDRFADALSKLG